MQTATDFRIELLPQTTTQDTIPPSSFFVYQSTLRQSYKSSAKKESASNDGQPKVNSLPAAFFVLVPPSPFARP